MESEQEKTTIEHVRKISEVEEEESKILEEDVSKISEVEDEESKILEEDVRKISEVEEEESKILEEDVTKISDVEKEESEILEEEEKARPSSSSESSSSSSSSRASFELDGDIVESNPVNDSIPKSKSDGDLSRGQESTASPNCPAHTPRRSMSSTSASPPQVTSPPVQTMEHPPDYNPDRIPASVFASKPANTSEWSVASNDSLFSIHVGNNSFTKDMLRSGELKKLEELNNVQSPFNVSEAKSPNELCSLPASLPPLMEVPANEEGSAKSSCVSTIEKEVGHMKGASTSRLSTESGRSTSSFAFPVLEGEGGKASPLQRVEEKPELQTQDSIDTTPKATTSRWFSWCSCLPRCC